jgi:hypothetical protein
MEEENSANVEAESLDNNELSLGSLDDLRNLEVEEAPTEKLEAATKELVEPKADELSEEESVEYTPDFTYKVKDEVFEFDESVREAIKSKEVEDKFRDLYTRAAGLDDYKAKYSDVESKYNESQPQLERLIGGYKTLMSYRDDGDFDRLMSTLGVDEEALIEYVGQLLEREELPEEQQTALRQNREMEDKISYLESQMQNYQAAEQNQRIEAEKNELSQILQSNDYADGVSLLNEVGLNFEQEVIKAGEAIVAQEQRYPSVAEAVQKAYEARQPLLNRLKAQTQTQTEPGAQQQVVTEKVVERHPTLPKVKGANSNKVDEVISFDKLREISNAIPTR